MINEYDELKALIKKSKMLMEQKGPINMGKSIEDTIEDDEVEMGTDTNYSPKKEKSKTYRISGGLLTLNGIDKKDVELTTEEKTAFQETMDEFVQDVSDLSDFGVLNVYQNSVEWGGKILDADIEFFYTMN